MFFAMKLLEIRETEHQKEKNKTKKKKNVTKSCHMW
jgi:hypothetical protein